MMCTALAIIVGSAVYIIGEQQGGLRYHQNKYQNDNKVISRALRFMSPVSLWSDMRKEKERKSLDRADHEEERNLGKKGRKKNKKKKKKKKKKRPKAEKSQSLKGSTTAIVSAITIKDAVAAVAVVEPSAEPKASKSDKAMDNNTSSYTLPFAEDTVS